MFTKGQQLFALVFAVAFIVIVIFAYRKDIPIHRKYYRKIWMVLLGIAVVIGLFVLIAHLIQN